MMHHIINLFGNLLAPAAQKFLHALDNPQKIQQSVQQEIVYRLAKSEYGKFLGINSIADWYRIPIVEYQDIQEWIEKQKKIKTPILTPEPILFYEKTSGSSGAAKWIPYTQSLRSSFNHMFCVWAHDLIQHGPKFSTGKIYFCISPQLGNDATTQYSSVNHVQSKKIPPTPLKKGGFVPPFLRGVRGDRFLSEPYCATTESGVKVGLKDDSEYLDGWLRQFLSPFLVSPPGINSLRNPEEFKNKLSQTLLLEENLEIISIWSPTFLKVHLDYIQEQQKRLVSELGNKLSAERQKLLLKPEIPWTKLWRELKLISCWDSGNAADGAGFLRSLFPGVTIQGKGLLATEAPITIPLIAAQGCVPLVDEVFFEFQDETGKIHRLHELEMGNVYEIIISQKGGLYRYRIGDRVRVTHFYKNTPCLEFIGRSQEISDLVGEKLHSEFVREIIESLSLEGTFFKSLVPATFPQEHYILFLDTAKQPTDAIARQLDEALMRSHHYKKARLLGQLSPVRVLVSRQIPETLTMYKTQSGSKWGDLKHQLFVTKPIEEKLLIELEKLSCAVI